MNNITDMFNLSTDAVFGIDKTGVIRFANSTFEQLLGYSSTKICGNQCAKVMCGTDLCGKTFCGSHCSILKTSASQPQTSDFDIIIKHANGHDVLVNIGANYIYPQPDGISDQIIVFFTIRQVNPQRMLQRISITANNKTFNSDKTGYSQLTVREKEILCLASKGKKTSQIGDLLFISTQTVRTHFKNIYQKLGVNSRTEAVIFSLQQNEPNMG